MADHPLRPATDRRLGGLLPHQLANQTSAARITRGLSIPRFPPQGVCGINPAFAELSPITRYIPMHYSPVRHSPPGASSRAAVRLACVKHAASVQSEPGSNSSVQSQANFLARKFKEINKYLLSLAVQVSAFAKHLHLSVIRSVKEQCLRRFRHTGEPFRFRCFVRCVS